MTPLALAAAEAVDRPTTLMHVTTVAELLVVGAVVVVLGRRMRARPTPATRWALCLFAVLTAVLVTGLFEVHDEDLASHLLTLAVIVLLLAVPYLLVLLARSLGAVGRRGHAVAATLYAAEVLATLVVPEFPGPEEEQPGWFAAYAAVVIGAWTVQSVIAAVGLWRSGRGQPSVVRHRMRTLAIGAVVLAVTLNLSGAVADRGGAAQAAVTLLGAASMLLLAVAFVVPDWLRQAWRAEDIARLAAVERGLMAAVTPAEVAGEILPAMARLFGGRGAAILDTALRPVEVRGLTPVDLAALDVDLPDLELPVGEVVITPHDALACRLTDGWLVVHAGPLAPVLGPAELALVERVGTFLDLALERCRLFDEEARSRRSAESANAELQTLLYSVSHDLRSPIISVLGYLDVLRQEHSGELTGDGDRYLERIEVNAVYMQNLIQDLLELSRIGRTESTPSSVDLGALARSVAQEVAATHPDVGIEVGDRLPVVSMNAVRARQLLTNLLDNAAKHAGHDAPRVTVAAEPRPDGSAVLRITDNGRGVPEAYRAKAFEVFERLDAARLGTPGTGMGLPICRRVVETLGGTIVLGGPAEGTATGTTVTIVLPPPVVEQWPTRQEHHLMEESA